MAELDDRIASLIEPLLDERMALLGKRENLIAQRQRVDAEIVKVERVLRAAGHKLETGEKKKSNEPKTGAVSPERLRQISSYFGARPDEKFSVNDVMGGLGMARSSVTNALAMLRDEGVIRLAGYRGHEKVYALMGVPENGNNLERGPVSSDEARERVLRAFAEIAPTYVARIADATALHTSTVSNQVAKLVEEGIVIQVGEEMSTRGRPMKIYALTNGVWKGAV